MSSKSRPTKAELVELISPILPMEPEGLHRNEIIKKLGKPEPHSQTLERALGELADAGRIVKSISHRNGKRYITYSRPSINMENPELITVVRARNVMSDAGLMALRRRGETSSRIMKHLVKKLVLDAIHCNLDILKFRLDEGSFNVTYETIGDALAEYSLQSIFELMHTLRVAFRDDFDRIYGEMLTTILCESGSEIRKLVGIMKSVNPSYRLRHAYFEKDAKAAYSGR